MRIYNLLAHGPNFQRIPVHPSVLPVVEGVLDPGLLVSSLSSIAIGPGETAQPVHADDQIMPLPKPHPATVCNTMWALTDFTEANGATRLVPGSHRADHSPDLRAEYETVPAEMRRGSVLVWHGSLWHGGGANSTGHRRVGIAMNYCAGYIRQQENQQLGLPLAMVGTFPSRLQDLAGSVSTVDSSATSTSRRRRRCSWTEGPTPGSSGTAPDRIGTRRAAAPGWPRPGSGATFRRREGRPPPKWSERGHDPLTAGDRAGQGIVLWRRRAESNRRTGLCRPLPKPLGHAARSAA